MEQEEVVWARNRVDGQGQQEQGGGITESDPQPTIGSLTVNEANVLNAIASFIRRFVFLPRESHYVLVAAWVISTYLHKEFDFTGYLFAHSPEPQSGK